MVFCTLFDSRYIDKGIVMYRSLENVCNNDFQLYVIAFDDTCYEILSKLGFENLTLISMKDFEAEELLRAKANRNPKEYIWTCSCMSIKYVLEKYKEESCTYIDADMFFYSTPKPLFDEIDESGADVGIMRHGYVEDKENKRYADYSGIYCVEFNYFRNNENGLRVLKWWCDSCLECCKEMSDGIHFGDQKYLEQFEKRFTNIHVFENKGAGIAPWNVSKYEMRDNDTYYELLEKNDVNKKTFSLIFYHFQQITFISDNQININANMYPGKIQRKLTNKLYLDYMIQIERVRDELKTKFHLDLQSETVYREKEQFRDFLIATIRFERDPFIALKRMVRWIFRKRYDYITWR